MASKLGMLEERCLFWTTPKPFYDYERQSPTFTFQNSDWCFKLIADFNYYKIFMQNQSEKADIQPFAITACLVRGEYTPISRTVTDVSHASQMIWSSKMDTVMKEINNLHTVGILGFRFIFHGEFACTLNIGPKSDKQPVFKVLEPTTCLENLSHDFGKLLDEGLSHDVELKCGDRTIKAHRNILSARSGVFKDIGEDIGESRTILVKIADMEDGEFQAFMRYLYTGKLQELNMDTAQRFYELGNKYAVEGLKKCCARFFMQNLTHQSACAMLVKADLLGDPDFKESVIRYILEEKIPLSNEHWTQFCDGHPKLALEVYGRFYNLHCST